MTKKSVVIAGAGPCGLVALKEMREAGHDAVAVDEGPGIGGVFRVVDRTQYENLYLTISNMLMAFSDFPPADLRAKYSPTQEYGEYLEAYADAFELRPHLRLNTTVERARLGADGRWRVEVRGAGAELEVLEADALLVATGSSHVPRRIEVGDFSGEVLHSSEFRSAAAFAGRRVLVVGSGESASDIAADIGKVAAETVLWSRSPMLMAPRYPGLMAADVEHDELEFMGDEDKWSRAKISDMLETLTTSRMANATPMWAYVTVRHAILAVTRKASPASAVASAWARQAIAGEPLLGDQVAPPTKSARLATEAARGRVRVVVAQRAEFSERGARFFEFVPKAPGWPAAAGQELTGFDDIETIVLCTGFRSDFSWIEIEDLDPNPRSWFKHCFPPGLGDKLMFLGWARPHQGGIPACAEMLSRYIALLLAGERSLPADYGERARREAADERRFYVHATHVDNLVDYPAFMDSLARMIGCLPEPPPASEPERLAQYWLYPNWPLWYRQVGPGARPELVERVLAAFPLRQTYGANPFNMMTLLFSLMQAPIEALRAPEAGLGRGWMFKAKRHLLHGNARS